MDLLRHRLDGVTRPRHLLNESRPHKLNPFLVQHPANAGVARFTSTAAARAMKAATTAAKQAIVSRQELRLAAPASQAAKSLSLSCDHPTLCAARIATGFATEIQMNRHSPDDPWFRRPFANR
jgi:hypothetical protein